MSKKHKSEAVYQSHEQWDQGINSAARSPKKDGLECMVQPTPNPSKMRTLNESNQLCSLVVKKANIHPSDTEAKL